MSFLNAIQSFMPRPEHRSRAEIDRDLEDEFAFHLEMKARAVMSESGQDRSSAEGEARRRFGDIPRITAACRRIALKERIMLQRINFIMLIVLTLVVVGVSVQMWITQRHNTLALQDITTQLAKLRVDAAADERIPLSPGVVYVDGAIKRPGTYSLPKHSPLTLRRLITGAGGFRNPLSEYEVTINGLNEVGNPVLRLRLEHLMADGDEDALLKPNDRVYVRTMAEQNAIEIPTSGAWELVDNNYPLVMAFITPTDLRYKPFTASNVPQGFIPLGNSNLMFLSSMEVRIAMDDRNMLAGRWTWDDGDLLISAADAFPNFSQPMRFRRTASTAIGSEASTQPSPTQASSSIDDSDPAASTVSPFTDVRWDDWTPHVNISSKWYELRAIEGTAIEDIIAHARAAHGDEQARMRFSEDPLAVLREMNISHGDTVKLTLRDPDTGAIIGIN